MGWIFSFGFAIIYTSNSLEKTLIIGFSGPKGCGKDKAFEIIKRNYPDLKVKKIAFADPIRKKLFEIFNLNENSYDNLKRSENVTILGSTAVISRVDGREIVRGIGMLMRSYDEDQFVNYVRKEVLTNTDTIYICTDVRFENEVEMFKEMGCPIALIKREGYHYDNHVSERQISHYDELIVNDSLEKFEKRVIEFFEKTISI